MTRCERSSTPLGDHRGQNRPLPKPDDPSDPHDPRDPFVQIRLSDLLALQRAAAGNAEPAARREPAMPDPQHEVVTSKEAAAILGIRPKSLEQMRSEGRGPKFFRVGRSIRYRRSDLIILRDPKTE